jgi:hypothetical protein
LGYGATDHRDDNPSLKPLVPEALASAYRDAAFPGDDVSHGLPVDGR